MPIVTCYLNNTHDSTQGTTLGSRPTPCTSLGEVLPVRKGRDLARTPRIISMPTMESGGNPHKGPNDTGGAELPRKLKKHAKDRDRDRSGGSEQL